VIVGNGIDIVEIARIERALARRGGRFRARVFTALERRDCERRRRPGPHFALRFAAKEAGMKAMGTGWRDGVGWHDFEVVEAETGLEIRISGRSSELAAERRSERAWLGASTTRTHAVAQVLLERTEGV
jgi:holo-[acyl-carrier protein] synthase